MDPFTGAAQGTLESSYRAGLLVFSPCSCLLAIATIDPHHVIIWDLAKKAMISERKQAPNDSRYFSQDSTRLYVGGNVLEIILSHEDGSKHDEIRESPTYGVSQNTRWIAWKGQDVLRILPSDRCPVAIRNYHGFIADENTLTTVLH